MIKLRVVSLKVGFEVLIMVGGQVVRRQNFQNKSELEFFIMGFNTFQGVINDLTSFGEEE